MQTVGSYNPATAANNMAQKASMVNPGMLAESALGVNKPNGLSKNQRVKETEKGGEAEVEDGGKLNGKQETRRARRGQFNRQDGLQRLGRGSPEWAEADGSMNRRLPPSLQPMYQGAGSTNEWGVPFWLLLPAKFAQKLSAVAAHMMILLGLRKYVTNEVEQYIKEQAIYPKKVCREVLNVLKEDPSETFYIADRNYTGEQSGLSTVNWNQATRTLELIEREETQPDLDLVA